MSIATGTDLSEIINSTKLEEAAFALLTAWLLLKFVDNAARVLSERAPRARFFFNSLAPIIRFAVYFGFGYVLISIVAPTSEARVTLLASSGLAIGLGAQDLIKDLIAGVVILTDRPYQLGDRVKIHDAYGEIDSIGMRSTKLTTSDDTRVTIANSVAIAGLAWNSNGGVPDCQVATEMMLPIGIDPDEAIRIGYEAAYCSPFLLRSKPVAVLISDQFDQLPYCKLKIKAYVFDHRFEPKLMSDVTARAKRAFLARGLLHPWTNPKCDQCL